MRQALALLVVQHTQLRAGALRVGGRSAAADAQPLQLVPYKATNAAVPTLRPNPLTPARTLWIPYSDARPQSPSPALALSRSMPPLPSKPPLRRSRRLSYFELMRARFGPDGCAALAGGTGTRTLRKSPPTCGIFRRGEPRKLELQHASQGSSARPISRGAVAVQICAREGLRPPWPIPSAVYPSSPACAAADPPHSVEAVTRAPLQRWRPGGGAENSTGGDARHCATASHRRLRRCREARARRLLRPSLPVQRCRG